MKFVHVDEEALWREVYLTALKTKRLDPTTAADHAVSEYRKRVKWDEGCNEDPVVGEQPTEQANTGRLRRLKDIDQLKQLDAGALAALVQLADQGPGEAYDLLYEYCREFSKYELKQPLRDWLYPKDPEKTPGSRLDPSLPPINFDYAW